MTEGDPGHDALVAGWADGKHCFVYVDGVEVGKWGCYEADEEAGYVIVDKLDEDGYPQINPEKPDEWWTERKEGTVKIEFRLP